MGEKLSRNDFIRINLAQITKDETDQFRVISAGYQKDFTCELCGQKHVMKVYTVKNLTTDLTIRIGCECVKHFNLGKTDLLSAENMLKRIERSILESKKNLIKTQGEKLFLLLPEAERNKYRYSKKEAKIEELGKEFFQAMPLSERTEFYYSAYMMYEALRLYGGGKSGYDSLTYTYQKGIYIYSKEEISAAVEKIGCRDFFEKEVAKRDNQKLFDRRRELTQKIIDFVYESKKARKLIDMDILSKIKEEAKELSYTKELEIDLEKLQLDIANIKARDAKYPWLFEYTGNNPSIINLRTVLIQYDPSESQMEQAKKKIEEEAQGIIEPSIDMMLDFLIKEYPNNTFYQSVFKQYSIRKSLSQSQEDHIRDDYKRGKK